MLLDATGEIADGWVAVTDGPIPAAGPVIVPHARLDEALAGRPAAGVAVANDVEPSVLHPFFARLGLIAIAFPAFADGRGFSIATRLRELGFEGCLRATGPVIADQFAFLLACGFDEVLVPADVAARQPAEQWTAQLGKISGHYQRGRPGLASILDRRMGGAQP